MTKRYYIPAESEHGAAIVVTGIEIGRIPCLPEYTDPALASDNFERYPTGTSYRLWCIERRAVDDGMITNAWAVDKIGDMAAALLIVIGGCFAVGLGTLL